MVDYARNWTTVPEQNRCEIVSKASSRYTDTLLTCHICTIYVQSKVWLTVLVVIVFYYLQHETLLVQRLESVF